MEQRESIKILLNTIALDPNRWTEEKTPFFRLIDLLPAIARHDFHAVELWQYHIDRLNNQELQEVRSAMADAGVRSPVLGIYPKIHLEGVDRDRELDHYTRLLDEAALLGVDLVKMFVGSMGSARLDADARGRSMEFLRALTSRAGERRLRLVGETHADTLFDTVESTLRTLEKLDSRRFGVCFQPYDASLLGAIGAFTALRHSVWHLHYQGRRGNEMCLLEDADLDYAAYTRHVVSSGFEGYLCIEFVKDCVVASPELIDVDLVLSNAQRDREFVMRQLRTG